MAVTDKAEKGWMRVEFEGTYRVRSPQGIKNQSVERPYHIFVPMSKRYLKDSSNLRAPFCSFYENRLKNKYPGMLGLYQTRLIEALNEDGSVINHPKALSYENLKEYIKEREYPINIGLYDDQQLRNEVVLYEKDADGQQHLQSWTEKVKGGSLAVGQELDALGDDMWEVVETDDDGFTPSRKDRETQLKHSKVKPNVEERRHPPLKNPPKEPEYIEMPDPDPPVKKQKVASGYDPLFD